jgi:DNA-directed RNA polymerase specialized sigma24 family protein
VQGYSYDEISEIIKIPLGTVKSRINAARHRLRNELSQ